MKNPFLAFSCAGWIVTDITQRLGQLTISDWAGIATIFAALFAVAKDFPQFIRNWTQKRK